MADETNAIYKILADFSALGVAKKKAVQDLKDLERAERDFNKNSAKNAKDAKAVSAARSQGYKDEAREARKATTALAGYKNALKSANQQQVNLNGNIRRSVTLFTNYKDSVRAAREDVAGLRKEHEGLNKAMTGSKGNNRDTNYTRLIREQTEAMTKLSEALRVNSREVSNNERTHDRNGRAIHRMGANATRASSSLGALSRQMNKFRDFRPRLIPPFVALIPIIGALLGLINPLVAGLSAAGVAAFGLGANLASVSGIALAAIPGLVALISVIGALKASFNGVGEAFKQFGAMQKAAKAPGAGGAGAKSELTRAEEIVRAETRVARAQQDVTFAQEDLTKAREEYYETIKKLTEQLEDLAEAEDKAQANAQLAAEWAETVAADPDASEADKQAAADFAVEKAEEAEEATKARQEGEKDLKEARGTGVNNDRDVIMAQRRLIDSQWALRDAQLELINTQKGLNGAMGASATAAAAYAAALAALSPSARAFVEFLTSMYDAWKKVQRTVQETFFSQFVGDLDNLKRLLGPISTLLNDAAEALGKLFGNLITQVTSPEWLSDLTNMSSTNVTIIESLGKAFQYILEVMKDIAIVAAPLAEKMATGFSEGLGRFMTVVDNARSDGSLSAWLDTVYKRLQKWWTIVKNIGKTLFNYGAAASEFGEWITDGLVNLTKSWVDSSKGAREEGSAFKDYLDDIKEPLRAVGRLMKAFFGWWTRVSSDEDNLESFTRIMDSITTKLGPAISRLLDLFAKSHTADLLIDSLVQILDLLQKFLVKGGLEGFEAFFSVMHDFFSVLTDFVDAMPEGVIKALAISLAVISALTFTGLGRVLQLFAKILKSPSLGKLFAGLKGIGVSATAAAATTAGSAVVTGGGSSKPKGGMLKGVGAGIAGIGLGLAGSAVSDGNDGGRDIAGGALSGAGLGLFVGSIFGPIGAAFGAGLGAVLGAGIEAIDQVSTRRREKEERDEKKANSEGKTYYRSASDNFTSPTLVTFSQATAREQTDKAFGGAAPSYDASGTGAAGLGSTNDLTLYRKQNQAYNNMYNSLILVNAQVDLYSRRQETAERNTRLMNEATITASEYQSLYAEALVYTNSVYEAQQSLEAAKAVVDAANLASTEALTQAEKEKAETGKISEDTQLRLQIAAEDMATAYRQQADAVLAAGGTQEEANVILKRGETRLDKFAEKAGLSAKNVNDLKGKILSLPTAKVIDLRLQMTKADRSMMTNLFAAMGVGLTATVEQTTNYGAAKGNKKSTGGSINRATGGSIPKVFEDWKGVVAGRGVNDSVRTNLTPGEFVMRRSAVQKIGVNRLRQMNAGQLSTRPGVPQSVLDHSMSRSRGSSLPQLSGGNGYGSKSSGFAGKLEVNVVNPVAQTAEASLAAVAQELAYKYGW